MYFIDAYSGYYKDSFKKRVYATLHMIYMQYMD